MANMSLTDDFLGFGNFFSDSASADRTLISADSLTSVGVFFEEGPATMIKVQVTEI